MPTNVLTLATALVGAALGWALGLASAHVTHAVFEDDPVAARRLTPDLLVQAGVAVIWLLLPVVTPGPVWRWLAAGLLAVPLVQVAVTDLRHGYVYTATAVVGVVGGLFLGWAVHGAEWWWGLAGALLGLGTFGLLYALGRLLYRGGEPLARGDVTIAAMVGAVAGPYVVSALVAGIILSGLAAIGVWLAKRSRHAVMPYGPGLCLGGLLSLFAGAGR